MFRNHPNHLDPRIHVGQRSYHSGLCRTHVFARFRSDASWPSFRQIATRLSCRSEVRRIGRKPRNTVSDPQSVSAHVFGKCDVFMCCVFLQFLFGSNSKPFVTSRHLYAGLWPVSFKERVIHADLTTDIGPIWTRETRILLEPNGCKLLGRSEAKRSGVR